MSESPEVSKAIYAEQLKLLYAGLPLSIIATLINSVILLLVMWSVLDHSHLLVWLAMMSFVLLTRAGFMVGYKRRQNDYGLNHWSKLFIVGAIATAFVWMSFTLFLFPTKIEYQVFLCLVLAGTTAGAVTSLSYQRVSFLPYMAMLLIPLAIRFLLEGETIQLAMAAMVFVFMVFNLSASGRLYRDSRQNIAMRFESTHMQKALRQTEGKYQHIFESVPLAIAHFNAAGQILDSNAEFVELAGKNSQSISKWNLIKDSPDEGFSKAVEAGLRRGIARYEGKASVIGGSDEVEVRVHLGAVKAEDEAHEGVAIFEDLTEDKRLEKAKNEFVSSVSHELRTPMTSIIAVLKLMQAGKLGDIKDKAGEMVEIAVRNSERLLSLINDLLDIGRIEEGELYLDTKACSVTSVLKRAVEEMSPFAQQQNIDLQLQCSSMEHCINVDEGRYTQTLTNLLSNAIKFSPAGTAVIVNVVLHDGNVRVSIKDSGPGIPDEFQSELFKRFTQYDASDTKSAGGSGLGLNISYGLVRLMGGALWYETSPAEGTTFYIDFPLVEC
jgi:PAS domain S-box-containing protein